MKGFVCQYIEFVIYLHRHRHYPRYQKCSNHLTNGELYDNIPVIFIARREGEQDLYFGLLIDMNTTLLQWMLALLSKDLQKKIFAEGLTLEKIISESPQVFILTLTTNSSSVIEIQDKTILKRLL